jgi:SAM-dependent methyltransferase
MSDKTSGAISDVLFIPTDCIPDDHSRQVSAESMAREFIQRELGSASAPVILDLGCGEGNSVDFFRRLNPGARWLGVDIAGSPEVLARRRTDAEFHTFDGVHIPAADASVDLVFCKQVLTHAADPPALLRDVRRILKPTGAFIGSSAHLEPMMAYARTNHTPFGFASALDTVGLSLHELRPGIDSLTIILRRLFWMPRLFDRFYTSESPLNRLIGFAGKLRGKSARQINTRKLLFAGQYIFRAGISSRERKP